MRGQGAVGCEGDQYWNKLSRKFVKSFSLGIIKIWLDMALSNLLELTLLCAGRLHWMVSRCALKPQHFSALWPICPAAFDSEWQGKKSSNNLSIKICEITVNIKRKYFSNWGLLSQNPLKNVCLSADSFFLQRSQRLSMEIVHQFLKCLSCDQM